MPFNQRLQIVDEWSFIIIIANVLHTIYVIILLNPKDIKQTKGSMDLMFGFANFLIWVGITKYLKYSDSLNILPATSIRVGLPIAKQLIATLPIVIGLAFFMISNFGSSWRFNSFHKGLIMLWALWYSDEVQNVYHELTQVNFLLGTLFCYCWAFFVANIIHNVFLAMVEDGYVHQSRVSSFDWLNDELNDPDEIHIEGEDDDDEDHGREVTSEMFLAGIKKA
jgi:hypothetical protein